MRNWGTLRDSRPNKSANAMAKNSDNHVHQMSTFKWTPKTSEAATLLAQGYTHQQVADEVGVSKKTISRWLVDIEFSEEVDRLSLMVGIAGRAERLRVAQQIVRDKMAKAETFRTDKDLLDWLKFAQSETDGIKLDLAETFAKAAASLAGGGSESSDRKGQPAEDTATTGNPESNLS